MAALAAADAASDAAVEAAAEAAVDAAAEGAALLAAHRALEEAVLSKRFGTPAERIRESQSGAVHWLYPQHGLDVALGGDEKPVLQYLSPGDFELLRAPLLAQVEVLK